MITARDVCLTRVPHLRAAHRAILELSIAGDPLATRDRVVVVPTRHAGRELRRTLERLQLERDVGAFVLPHLLTRDALYEELHARARLASPLLSRLERQAIVQRSSEEAIHAGVAPPFSVRPGLLGDMLWLYDGVRRNRRTVDDFERVLVDALEPGAETDRGALRLLAQTRYLVALFRGYEEALASAGALDEHRLRDTLMSTAPTAPLSGVVITIADQVADADGLWPADFDLLLRLPGLTRIDVVATEAVLHTGFHARLFDWLPDIQERTWSRDDSSAPVLLTPPASTERAYFQRRDREEEMRAIASTAPGDDTIVVYQRPLPYVYVARRIFEGAGAPFSAADTLPLAAEPFAAAVDLVFEAAASGVSRAALLRLLESPLLSWRADRRPLASRDIALLGHKLSMVGFEAGRDELARLDPTFGVHPDRASSAAAGAAVRLRRAFQAALSAADELASLDQPRTVAAHCRALGSLLERRECLPWGNTAPDERQARARSGMRLLIDELARAHARFGRGEVPFSGFVLLVRRAIEEHTFAPVSAEGGVRLLDASCARFADAACAHVVGVVEGEWPPATRRSVFFPSGLLRDLGFPGEQERLPSARAAFHDLLILARERTAVSAFQLEDDAIVRPSVLIEDLDELPLVRVLVEENPVCGDQSLDPREAESTWSRLRARRSDPVAAGFHGAAGPTVPSVPSVTHVERYLECPFKYFAANVLGLEEEDERAAVGLSPRDRGTLVHAVFERFFADWAGAGHGAITPAKLPEARAVFAEVVERQLSILGELDRLIERTRLLGSAAAPGLGERVFRLEAMRPTAVLERRLEVSLRGIWNLGRETPRMIELKGKADRIDLLADGTLRIIDYKTGRAPDVKRAVQLGIYSLCAEQMLDGYHGRRWSVGEAAYVAFGDKRPWVSVVSDPGDREPLEQARRRFIEALDGIANGAFPPAPARRRSCRLCAFAAVCRKDYVGEPA